MSDWTHNATEAVIICTRNRPSDLRTTVRSVSQQLGTQERALLIIDGSDDSHAAENATLEHRFSEVPLRYERYPKSPSITRQRNYGLDLIPSSVEIIHFLDDDVTLLPGYFEALAQVFRQNASYGGVGGVEKRSLPPSPSPHNHLFRRLFLLSTDAPGRVLSSGRTTAAHRTGSRIPYGVEWLSNCAVAYRRSVFSTHRFDPSITGLPPTLEDLDFSYRVAQQWPLAVSPAAKFLHRTSPKSRRNVEETQRERVIRRYWFVQKNLRSYTSRLAFWWAMLGRLIATSFTNNSNSAAANRGIRRGLKAILQSDLPFLRS